MEARRWCLSISKSATLVLSGSVMAEPAVKLSVVARAKNWPFPRPIGGGIVNVTFPWFFVLPARDVGLDEEWGGSPG